MNINVINNVDKELNVIVNKENNDNIEIIIDLKNDNIDLLALKQGDVFHKNNVEYIVLEQLPDKQTVVIRKYLLENKMEFDSDNNNWKTSSIRERLNNNVDGYLREVEDAFGKDKIVTHTVDLLSLDGLDDYGTSNDKISLLTIDQYRKYRKILSENINKWWWLLTPDSTSSGSSASYVQYVRSGGFVCCGRCGCGGGVRPFFIIQS